MSPVLTCRHAVTGFVAVATALALTIAVAPAAQASPATVTDDTAGVRGVVHSTLQYGDRIYIGGDFDFAGRWSGAGQVVDAGIGRVASPALRIVGQVNVATPDGQGGWFIGGSFTQVLGQKRLGLARITKAGKLSPFRADVTGSVNALAFKSGVLYAGGSFSGIGGTSRANLAAVAADTSTVTSWNPAANGSVHTLEISGSGTALVAGGSFAQVGGANRSSAAELGIADGLASAWNPNVTGTVKAIEVNGSGDVYLGGDFTAVGGASRTDLAAVSPTTAAATDWAPTTDGAVNALTLRPGDPRVFVGGSFANAAGQARQNLAAIGTDGLADSWTADTNGEVHDLDTNSTGDVIASGAFTSVDATERLRGAALSATGDVLAWNPGTDDTIRAASVSTFQGISRTLLGGNFSYVNGAARQNIAAIDVATGDLDRSFVADTDDIVKALAISGDGSRLFVGGGFQNVNGSFRSRLAALDAATGSLHSWSANAGGSVNGLAVNGDALYVGGGFASIGGEQVARLAKVSASTSTVDTSFQPTPGGVVRAVEVTADGSKIFAVGGFTSVGGQQRPGAALVNANGSVGSWAPSEGGAAIAADLSPDQNRLYFSTSKNRMFAYDYASPGGNSPTWITRTGGDVQAIAATASEVYVGGHFRNFPEEHLARPHLASVYVGTGLATPWSPGANGSFGVWSITATANSLLIGGDFDRAGGRRQPGFARFAGNP